MAISQIWRCSDGTVFSDVDEAKKHENEITGVIIYGVCGTKYYLSELFDLGIVIECPTPESYDSFIQQASNHAKVIGSGVGVYMWSIDDNGNNFYVKIPPATKTCIATLCKNGEVF